MGKAELASPLHPLFLANTTQRASTLVRGEGRSFDGLPVVDVPLRVPGALQKRSPRTTRQMLVRVTVKVLSAMHANNHGVWIEFDTSGSRSFYHETPMASSSETKPSYKTSSSTASSEPAYASAIAIAQRSPPPRPPARVSST